MEKITQKKKMLVTASTFPRWKGDTEPRFVLDYASAMNRFYDVTVLVPATEGAKDSEVINGVKIIRYHYFPVHKWETLCYPGAIVPRIKEKKVRALLVPCLILSLWFHLLFLLPKYDMVHAHWLIPQGIIQSFFKKPYIVTGHGGDISSFNKSIIKILKKKCMRNAKSVVVVSKYKERELKQHFPDIKCELISMGVNTNFFAKENNYRENYFEQGNKKVVLFVGRLAEIKGVEYLIQALKNEKEIVLVVVGEGPLRKKLEEETLNAQCDVKFLGSKSHNELKHIYASADVLVVPSISDEKGAQEGLPTVILEAFAAKLPVIATNTGGIPDIVRTEQTGILVSQKNEADIKRAVGKILGDAEFREKIVINAYKKVQEYDYAAIAEKYNELIKGKI